jgi:hypothetical protein
MEILNGSPVVAEITQTVGLPFGVDSSEGPNILNYD